MLVKFGTKFCHSYPRLLLFHSAGYTFCFKVPSQTRMRYGILLFLCRNSTDETRIREEHFKLESVCGILSWRCWSDVVWAFSFFSVPEPKASRCIQPGGENKVLMRNDSGRSNTSAKQYYLRQSRYLPGKTKSQFIRKVQPVNNLHIVHLNFRFHTG